MGLTRCYKMARWWAMPPSLSNIRRKWPIPFEKRRLQPISAHNVSIVRDSEKSSITTNIKSTTGFPTSYTRSAYVTPKCPKGWLKEGVFLLFLSKSQLTADRLRCCHLCSPMSIINIWWSAAMLITSTVEICIQHLGRVKEIVWLPCDAGMSAAAESLSVPPFTRVFLNFFTLTFRALGEHCHDIGHDNRMTSYLK